MLLSCPGGVEIGCDAIDTDTTAPDASSFVIGINKRCFRWPTSLNLGHHRWFLASVSAGVHHGCLSAYF